MADLDAVAAEWGDTERPANMRNADDSHDRQNGDALSDYDLDFWAADSNGKLFSEDEAEDVACDNADPVPCKSGNQASSSTKQGTAGRKDSGDNARSKVKKQVYKRNTDPPSFCD